MVFSVCGDLTAGKRNRLCKKQANRAFLKMNNKFYDWLIDCWTLCYINIQLELKLKLKNNNWNNTGSRGQTCCLACASSLSGICYRYHLPPERYLGSICLPHRLILWSVPSHLVGNVCDITPLPMSCTNSLSGTGWAFSAIKLQWNLACHLWAPGHFPGCCCPTQ